MIKSAKRQRKEWNNYQALSLLILRSFEFLADDSRTVSVHQIQYFSIAIYFFEVENRRLSDFLGICLAQWPKSEPRSTFRSENKQDAPSQNLFSPYFKEFYPCEIRKLVTRVLNSKHVCALCLHSTETGGEIQNTKTLDKTMAANEESSKTINNFVCTALFFATAQIYTSIVFSVESLETFCSSLYPIMNTCRGWMLGRNGMLFCQYGSGKTWGYSNI